MTSPLRAKVFEGCNHHKRPLRQGFSYHCHDCSLQAIRNLVTECDRMEEELEQLRRKND